MSGMFQLYGGSLSSESVWLTTVDSCVPALNIALDASPFLTLEEAVTAFKEGYIDPFGLTVVETLPNKPNTVTASFAFDQYASPAKLVVTFTSITSRERLFNIARIFHAIAQSTSDVNTLVFTLLDISNNSSTYRVKLKDNFYEVNSGYLRLRFNRIFSQDDEHFGIVERAALFQSCQLPASMTYENFLPDSFDVVIDIRKAHDANAAVGFTLELLWLDETHPGLYDPYLFLKDEIFPVLV